ncbi:MAG: transposase [Okeania sp. SIO3B5]|uniref:RNA-guided endonuclease InsQ/TnpB family protein n=1 Tax=Okeania sp. SIO3B5 TaxID=2607811 RepID=UPI0014005C63|nr:transposase [Okeania sp. SIO3B5]NEO56880.1 transposase [Okeania sp. SIO3B5]
MPVACCLRTALYLEGSIKIFQGNYIQLPRIGVVKTYEILPNCRVKNVRISKRADSWYISFKYDIGSAPTEKVGETIGVDIGINTLATCSDGSKFANVKAYRQAKKQLVRHQRAVSKKVIGSKNRLKAVKKLAKVHKKADATPRRRQLACGTRTKQLLISEQMLYINSRHGRALNHSTIVIEV